MAKKYHPDLHPENQWAEERFKQISQAYKILSDDTERWRYDQMRARLAAQPQRPAAQRRGSPKRPYPYQRQKPPQSRPHYYQRPRYYKFNPEEEKKAWRYAIGIIAIVAVIVLTATSISKYYKQKVYEARVNTANELMASVKGAFAQEDIRLAVSKLHVLRDSLAPKGADINRYISDWAKKEGNAGKSAYQAAQYDQALQGLLILFVFSPQQPETFYYQLSICYIKIGQAQKGIEILDGLMARDLHPIKYAGEIGGIYIDQLQDTTLAMKYYGIALQRIFNRFETEYGKAYRLLVNPKRTPDYYSGIFYDAGKLYFGRQNFPESARLFEWSAFLAEKNKGESYHYLGLSYKQMQKQVNACNAFKRARENGYPESNENMALCEN